ncbi:MAG: BolA family protein [Gammaproteobacteria bacterium]
MEDKITQKILNAFNVENLFIENESHLHAGQTSNSHFKIILISNDFEKLTLIQRHKAVYDTLKEEMKSIHALSLHLFSTNEDIQQDLLISPNCSKKK